MICGKWREIQAVLCRKTGGGLFGVENTVRHRGDPERLHQIDMAEAALRRLGFSGFRVRYHNDVARLELRPQDITRVLENGIKDKIIDEIKKAGFKYVALDLEGYRQGSLNQNIKSGE